MTSPILLNIEPIIAGVLASSIVVEVAPVSGAGIFEISGALSTEVSERVSADTSLTTRLSSEEVTRASGDTSLTTRLSSEEVTRALGDTSLTTRLSSEEVTRASVDASIATNVNNLIASADAMVFKGLIDCSTNPNYPAADTGWTYRVSVAGKIGGPSGVSVESGDILICAIDGTLSGDQSSVGSNWGIVQANINWSEVESSITSRISAEEVTRASADTSLTSRLSAEEIARASADVSIASAYLPLAGGVMTGVLAFLAGTASLPGLAVAGDLNTGIYGVSADVLGVSAGGQNVATFAAGLATVAGVVRPDADATRDLGTASARWLDAHIGRQVLIADGSATTPAYSFGSSTGTGFYRDAGGNRIRAARAGAYTGFNIGLGVIGLASDTGQIELGTAQDVILVRDAPNTLALRNSTNAQAFRVYNTTDGTNSEFVSLAFASGVARLTTDRVGTGLVRTLALGTGGNNHWLINSSGHLLAGADNIYDIGAVAANRPRNLFLAGTIATGGSITSGSSIVATTSVTLGAANGLNWSGRSVMRSPADGSWQLGNAAETSTVILAVDAANTLALRNGNNTQTLNLYRLTDGTNLERLSIYYSSGFNILTEAAGTGTVRDMRIGAGAGGGLYLRGGGTDRWVLYSTGVLNPAADATYDLASTGLRVRSGYFGTNVVIGNASTSTAQLHVGAGAVMTVANGTGGNTSAQLINSQTSGTAVITVGVNDGVNNRRAGLFVNQTDGLWGLGANVTTGAIPFIIYNNGAERLRISETGVATFYGNVLAGTDATYDLGASGASRFRDAWFSRNLTAGGTVTAGVVSASQGLFTSAVAFGVSSDLILLREAANTLALRNGANAQRLNIYNTYTDASNYERAGLYWTGNTFYIGTEAGGTGVNYSMRIATAGTGSIRIRAGGVDRWNFLSDGRFAPDADATYDLGTPFNRIRSGYFATNIVIGNASTSTAQLHVGAGAVQTIPNGGGSNISPQFINSQTSGTAALAVGVSDGTNNRRAGLFVNDTNGLWGVSHTFSSGGAFPFVVNIAGTEVLRVGTTGVATFYGNVLFSADATYNIGASGASRPNNGWFAGNLDVAGQLRPGSILVGVGAARATLTASADGVLTLYNTAVTGFTGIKMGGITASQPYLKVNGANLQGRLADDTDFNWFQAKLQTHANAVAETPTATHTLTLYDAAGTAYKVLAVAA